MVTVKENILKTRDKPLFRGRADRVPPLAAGGVRLGQSDSKLHGRWGRGLHSSEEAFLLINQQPRVRFLAYPKLSLDAVEIYKGIVDMGLKMLIALIQYWLVASTKNFYDLFQRRIKIFSDVKNKSKYLILVLKEYIQHYHCQSLRLIDLVLLQECDHFHDIIRIHHIIIIYQQ